MSNIIKINPVRPEPDIIREGSRIMKQGGVVVFPTQCLYGLGANAFNDRAVDRVYKLKRRPSQNPILVLISDRSELSGLVRRVPAIAHPLMDRFWPGMVTMVFEADDKLPVSLTAGAGKIGVRLCGHPAALALVKAAGVPITATSANISGETGCSQISALSPQILSAVDLILDAGTLEGGPGSTVIDVTGNELKIVRQGVVSKDVLGIRSD